MSLQKGLAKLGGQREALKVRHPTAGFKSHIHSNLVIR